jgi:hypothetical protein
MLHFVFASKKENKWLGKVQAVSSNITSYSLKEICGWKILQLIDVFN